MHLFKTAKGISHAEEPLGVVNKLRQEQLQAEINEGILSAGWHRLMADDALDLTASSDILAFGFQLWSEYDLETVDKLYSALCDKNAYVALFIIDDLTNKEQFDKHLPGGVRDTVSPIIAVYQDGILVRTYYRGSAMRFATWLDETKTWPLRTIDDDVLIARGILRDKL